MDTDCHIRYTWKDGSWDAGELVKEPYLSIHIAASCLHYGQAAFEGMKAFRCKDGKIRVFSAPGKCRTSGENIASHLHAGGSRSPVLGCFVTCDQGKRGVCSLTGQAAHSIYARC